VSIGEKFAAVAVGLGAAFVGFVVGVVVFALGVTGPVIAVITGAAALAVLALGVFLLTKRSKARTEQVQGPPRKRNGRTALRAVATNLGVWLSLLGLSLFLFGTILALSDSGDSAVRWVAGLGGISLQFLGYSWMRTTIRRREW
jgi:hypothetical protein